MSPWGEMCGTTGRLTNGPQHHFSPFAAGIRHSFSDGGRIPTVSIVSVALSLGFESGIKV